MQSKQHLDQSYESFVSKSGSINCWKPPSRAISEYCPLERAIYNIIGGAVFIMCYLFRYYIILWEICRSKIVSGLELDTYKSEADHKIIGGVR